MTDRTMKNLDELVENDIVSARVEGISNEQKASILKNCSVANDMKMNDMKLDLQNQELSIREKEFELEKEKLKIQEHKDIYDMKLNDLKLDLQKQELSIREKELELEKEKIKTQNHKDICLTIVNGTIKILGIAACVITSAAFVGSSMRMTYQEQMVPPKSLWEGLKYISGIGSKLI